MRTRRLCAAGGGASGRRVVFSGNTFRGAPAVIRVDPNCTDADLRDNRGATVERAPVDFHHGRR